MGMAGGDNGAGPTDLAAGLAIPAAAFETAQALAEAVLRATADMPFAAEPQKFLEALESLGSLPEGAVQAGENK